jgi:predicted RNase H-like nuclease
VGVDGCPNGWVAVEADGRRWQARVFPTFGEILGAYAGAAAVGVDIPIGLPGDGRRQCDGLARARLGSRRSSVFPAPSRRLLEVVADAVDYREANRRCWERLGHGIGAQTFNIFAKIREVDALMTPARQLRVREVHPELSFTAIRGDASCRFAKRDLAGRDERLLALRVHFDGLAATPTPPRGAKLDDLLDALAASWTAGRFARGHAESVPAAPALDPRGLRMEIVF